MEKIDLGASPRPAAEYSEQSVEVRDWHAKINPKRTFKDSIVTCDVALSFNHKL